MRDQLLDAAQRLYRWMLHEHWRGDRIAGPDPGIRFNARIGRFVKSYLPVLPWADELSYMQAQGYWIIDCWLLLEWYGFDATPVALACSDFVVASQKAAGFWSYPNPEWGGRIATVEGCWAGLGLLASHEKVDHDRYLQAALKWHNFLIEEVGFQRPGGLLAVNYFAPTPGLTNWLSVPNNSTLLLWFLARLAQITGDARYLKPAGPVIEWLEAVQSAEGELPYAVATSGGRGRPHFLCYQYNAFEFVELLNYRRITGDERTTPILSRLASYLATGLTPSGAARYDCSRRRPDVLYYSTALARAISEASAQGLIPRAAGANRAFSRALALQSPGGNFPFYSSSNYIALTDRRSYPRYLAMILNHLLEEHASRLQVMEAKAPVSEVRVP